jgi:hypothetical protein
VSADGKAYQSFSPEVWKEIQEREAIQARRKRLLEQILS